MFRTLGEAIIILRRRWLLFSAIILTVWFPGNLLADFLAYYVFPEGEITKQLRLAMWIEGIFGPIYIGAMVYALARLKQGQDVSYGEAMAVGFRNWGRLFAARFMAGLIIFLGLVALIVPGILFLIRYAFLECVVVLEGIDAGKARQRSTDLTKGRRAKIFGAATVFFVCFTGLGLVLYLPQAFAEQLNLIAYDVVMDCLMNIAYAVVQITMFLFYWEAKTNEPAVAPAAGDDPQPQTEPPPVG
jgi:hypothetical protein